MEFETIRQELLEKLQEYDDLSAAVAVLSWDQTTYMPPQGAPARGRQIATLQRLAHEKLTASEIGTLLDSLQPQIDTLPAESDDAALHRVTRRIYDRATKVPSEFMATAANHFSESYSTWTTARPNNDFATMRPYLEKTLDLSREYASFFPGYAHIADPLIEGSDYGMIVETIRPIFQELRNQLAPLVATIAAQPQNADGFLYQHYPIAKQVDFGKDIIRQFGYDFDRGRLDETHHPYMTKFSLGDVRITTRSIENDLGGGMFGTFHEAGHALYELGINRDYQSTPLANGTSSGVHESQSRSWENLVGRSRGFWKRYYPQLQATFPDQLGSVDQDAFYKAVNKVEPTLIRVEADEVTYNLHVIIRFELELALLEGEIDIADLPAEWNARYESYLGITPPDDRDGVLQDVHWYAGFIGGAFQGYTLGNILAAQFYEQALAAHPQIPEEIENGHFATLLQWLQDNIYTHGSKFTTRQLLERITGSPEIRLDPYLAYLRGKYSEIYGF